MTDDLPPLPEPVACQWLQHGQVVNAFNHPPGDRCRWDYDGYWAKKGYDKAPLFTADQMRAYGDARAAAAVARERERCARICGDEDVAPTDDPCGVQKCIAAAIRKGE